MGKQEQNWTVSWRIGSSHGSETVEAVSAEEASKAAREAVAERRFGMKERKSSVIILSTGLTPTKIAA
jgi:hypothetical protein